MRNVGPEWRGLAEGFLRVGALEERFRDEWGPRLEEARRKKGETDRRKLRGRGRAALIAASVLALLLLAVGIVLPFLLSPVDAIAFFALALVVPAVPALYGFWALRHTPALLPDPSDLSGRWWEAIARGALSVRASAPNQPQRYYGDQGEVAFVLHLAGALPDGYVAVRGPLVARRLDADVVVVGPTGVRVYEVKNWNGAILCREGQWQRIKTYRGPGGQMLQEDETIRPFDKQWIREADAVKETLRRRMPERPDLHEAIGGGIIFAHKDVVFVEDGSCRVRTYRGHRMIRGGLYA